MNAFCVMPITFYIKVTTDRADGSLKKQLSSFKQVFNLLEEFKSFFDTENGKFVASTPKSPETTKAQLDNEQNEKQAESK